MKTLKEFRQLIQLGTKITLVKGTLHGFHHEYRWMNKPRVVCYIDHTAFALGDTVGAISGRAWIDWPLRSNLAFPAPNQFTIIRAGHALTYEFERVLR